MRGDSDNRNSRELLYIVQFGLVSTELTKAVAMDGDIIINLSAVRYKSLGQSSTPEKSVGSIPHALIFLFHDAFHFFPNTFDNTLHVDCVVRFRVSFFEGESLSHALFVISD